MKFFLIAFLFISPLLLSQPISRVQYIHMYKNIAIEEMRRTGIPASITLAQGILESGNGNSTLARKANNHFGIKCHGWEGKKVYHDDDHRNECFRKYKSAEESFYDHSDFLTIGPRYRFLFEYKPNDYKAWAKGLKKAGYATSRTYDRMLIKIIEDNELYKYDEAVLDGHKSIPLKPKKEPTPITKMTIGNNNRKYYKNNGVKYIIIQPDDDINSITTELGLFNWELTKYNDFTYRPDNSLHNGEKLYIQPKRRKAAIGIKKHEIKNNESLYLISQQYAIKYKRLCKLNRISPGYKPTKGETLNLRSKIKKHTESQLKNVNKGANTPLNENNTNKQHEFDILFNPD